jgi:hypothetical protein
MFVYTHTNIQSLSASAYCLLISNYFGLNACNSIIYRINIKTISRKNWIAPVFYGFFMPKNQPQKQNKSKLNYAKK